MEQQLLEKFVPSVFRQLPADCNAQPAEFVPGDAKTTVLAKNATIYAQVLPSADAIEIRYYHL